MKGGSDVFTGQFEQEEWFATQIPYERIVISGKGYISTEAIKLLTEKNINVILTDTYGNLVTAMHKVMSSPTAMNYRIAQYDTFRDPVKVLYLQKKLLADKLQSQINFLKDLRREEANEASDVVNALLNYGYTVLAGEIAKFVNGFGLDPYFGFMHKTHNSFQTLVYDLIEPFRWLVEYAVYKIAVEEPAHGRMIRKEEYAWTREGRIILDSGLIRRFLELLERIIQAERLFEFKHGIKRRDGLSMCQEITIAKIYVQNLADYCVGK